MFKISFDFDETTGKVTNMVVDKKEGKRKLAQGLPTVEVDTNKLIISDSALAKIGAVANDRININYWSVNNSSTFPLIGKSEAFSDKLAGNKLTKSNTVSFKGNQRDVLLQYGELFQLEDFKPGMYKLVPISDSDKPIISEVSEETNNILLTEQEELDSLDNIQIIIEEDELPF